MNKIKAKHIWISVCALALLVGCNTTEGEENSRESQSSAIETIESSSETSTSEVEPVADDVSLNVLDPIVNETNFSNEYGYQAWLDYLAAGEQYQMADIFDIENTTGSSSAEIDALFDDEIERVEAAVNENEKMVFYRYSDAPDGPYSEVSSFLAELTFYFMDDQLVFSAITPGLYTVSPTDALPMDQLTIMTSLAELEEAQPQIYTIAEMNVEGTTLRQVMVSSQPPADQEDVLLTALYYFIVDEEIIHYASLPFMNVSQDFPSGSVSLYNSYFNWLENQ